VSTLKGERLWASLWWGVSYMDLDKNGLGMGGIASGIDLNAPMEEQEAQQLRSWFLECQVLCIRGQSLTPHQFADVGRIFGEPQVQLLGDYRLNDPPEVTVISNYNKMAGGKPHVRATHWHTDDSYFATPAKATALFSVALPSTQTRTEFINTHAVLEHMPDHLRARIEGRQAVHKYHSRRGKAIVAIRTPEEEALTPDVAHPLIRTHPETRRQSLYINPNRIDNIVGMDEVESDALLDELYDFAFQEQFQYAHYWELGHMVIWDNRCTMHRATTNFEITERREFQRLLLKGDKPV
jgi:taurine dioxygenase